MPFFRRNADKNNDKPDKPEDGNVPEAGQPQEPAPAVPAAPAVPDSPAVQTDPAVLPLDQQTPVPERPAAAERPRFHTPEGFDFNRYFLAERRIILENVSYEVQRAQSTQLRLNVRDTIVAQLLGNAGVKVTYNRTLSFDPEGPFTLSVSFSVMLVFNPGTRGEVDWKTIDVAEEFKNNCPQLVQAMMSKITLLVAEITNANGTPILPTVIRQ